MRSDRSWSVSLHREGSVWKVGPAPDDLFGLSISRDGKAVATAGYGGSLRVYDLASGKQTFATDLKRGMITYCVTFTPDGNWIVFRSNMHGPTHVYAVEVKRTH